jgi:hypothetical protein
MVTVGDSIHIYHQSSDASNDFIHVKTLPGKQGRDVNLVVSGPNYIAVLELIELERNVEVHSLVWDEIQRMQAFAYISRSQNTFGWLRQRSCAFADLTQRPLLPTTVTRRQNRGTRALILKHKVSCSNSFRSDTELTMGNPRTSVWARSSFLMRRRTRRERGMKRRACYGAGVPQTANSTFRLLLCSKCKDVCGE